MIYEVTGPKSNRVITLTDEFLKFGTLSYAKFNEFPDVISSINPTFCCIYIK